MAAVSFVGDRAQHGTRLALGIDPRFDGAESGRRWIVSHRDTRLTLGDTSVVDRLPS